MTLYNKFKLAVDSGKRVSSAGASGIPFGMTRPLLAGIPGLFLITIRKLLLGVYPLSGGMFMRWLLSGFGIAYPTMPSTVIVILQVSTPTVIVFQASPSYLIGAVELFFAMWMLPSKVLHVLGVFPTTQIFRLAGMLFSGIVFRTPPFRTLYLISLGGRKGKRS